MSTLRNNRFLHCIEAYIAIKSTVSRSGHLLSTRFINAFFILQGLLMEWNMSLSLNPTSITLLMVHPCNVRDKYSNTYTRFTKELSQEKPKRSWIGTRQNILFIKSPFVSTSRTEKWIFREYIQKNKTLCCMYRYKCTILSISNSKGVQTIIYMCVFTRVYRRASGRGICTRLSNTLALWLAWWMECILSMNQLQLQRDRYCVCVSVWCVYIAPFSTVYYRYELVCVSYVHVCVCTLVWVVRVRVVRVVNPIMIPYERSHSPAAAVALIRWDTY